MPRSTFSVPFNQSTSDQRKARHSLIRRPKHTQTSGSDFSTALADAHTLGVFGREGLSFASRWGGPSPGTPEYLAWKMYTNYDGAHDGFGTVSVYNTNNGNSNLFSSYATLNSTGTTMTIMVLNKDPGNAAQVTFDL